ncbi:MAG: hypothetical protein ABFS09_13370 [Thermodesulfobacteriota bacterium]
MDINEICFGMGRQTDEESLSLFIRQFASPAVLETLIPRLSDEEITQTLDFLSKIMGSHFKESEYHTLFLGRKG